MMAAIGNYGLRASTTKECQPQIVSSEPWNSGKDGLWERRFEHSQYGDSSGMLLAGIGLVTESEEPLADEVSDGIPVRVKTWDPDGIRLTQSYCARWRK